jgi:hypothetical protein
VPPLKLLAPCRALAVCTDPSCVDTSAESSAVKAFAWNITAPGLKVAFAKSTNGSLAIRLKATWKDHSDFCVDIPGAWLSGLGHVALGFGARGSRVWGQGVHGRGKRGRAPAPACAAKQAAAATHVAEHSPPCRLTRCTLPATAAARPQHADDTSSTCKDIKSLCGPSGCQFSILTQGFFSDGQTTPVACKAVDAVPIALRERNAPGAQIPTCAALASVPRPPRCAAQPCPDESLPFLPPSCHLRSHAVPRRPGRPQRHLRRLRRGFLRKGPLPHPALRPVPQRPGRARPRLLGVHSLHRQLVAQRGTHRLP